ncbi:MAG TPA: hypothetical protein PLT08_09595 [Anaerolineales bacterium]|nr:hypothetical protein [Anaerolineales bacterium]
MTLPPFDLTLLINWVTSGFIGLIFGLISASVTYRYEKKRDEKAWEREKEKIQLQFQHDRDMFEAEVNQKIKELELQFQQRETEKIRQTLLAGLGNPSEVISRVERTNQIIKQEPKYVSYNLYIRPSFLNYLSTMENIFWLVLGVMVTVTVNSIISRHIPSPVWLWLILFGIFLFAEVILAFFIQHYKKVKATDDLMKEFYYEQSLELLKMKQKIQEQFRTASEKQNTG